MKEEANHFDKESKTLYRKSFILKRELSARIIYSETMMLCILSRDMIRREYMNSTSLIEDSESSNKVIMINGLSKKRNLGGQTYNMVFASKMSVFSLESDALFVKGCSISSDEAIIAIIIFYDKLVLLFTYPTIP